MIPVGNVQAASGSSDEMIYGADIGFLSQLEAQGVQWVDDNGNTRDALELLKEKGVNAVRLRVFVKPPEDFVWTKPDGTTCMLGYTDTQALLYNAKRAEELGMKIMVVFHYSDHFADPLIQDVPSEWKGASESELEQYVYDYTAYIMEKLAEEGVHPEWVQVGNEVSYGMSYYPYWTSSYDGDCIENVTYNLCQMAAQYGKEVMICETGELESNPTETYELLRKEMNALEVVPNNKGIGVFYWEPEVNSTVLPDGYALGAAESVGDKKLHFTDALNAFLTEPDYLNENCLYELMNINSQKAANVAGGSVENDANVEQYEYAEWNSQKWTFEKVEGDYYKIANKNSGKVLDVKAFSTEENGEVIQNDYNEGWNQQWKLVETANGTYKIQNRWSGLYLGILNESMENGARLVQVSEQAVSSEWFLLLAD